MDHQGAVSCPSLVRSPLIESGSVESAASGSPLFRVASDHHHHHHSSGSSSSSVGSDSSLSQDSVGRSLEELLEEDGEDEALSGHVGCYVRPRARARAPANERGDMTTHSIYLSISRSGYWSFDR